MEIIRDDVFKAALIKRIAEREFQERTGVHGSDLIYCVNKQALRRLQPQEPEEHETLLFSLGWSTQRWLTDEKMDAEGVELDGIVVTPDYIMGGEAAVWELKATYQSSSKPIIENIAWIRQMMAQCKVTQTLVAYLSRFEVMGDWKWIFKPKEYKTWTEEAKEAYMKEHPHPTLSAYRLEFTQQEIDGNWAWLVKRRELFLKILETGQLVPKLEALGEGMEFECNYCGYREECDEGTSLPVPFDYPEEE